MLGLINRPDGLYMIVVLAISISFLSLALIPLFISVLCKIEKIVRRF